MDQDHSKLAADIVEKMKMKKKAKIIEMTTKRAKMWDKDKVLHQATWNNSKMHKLTQPTSWLGNLKKSAHAKKGDCQVREPIFSTSTNSLIRSKSGLPGRGSKNSIQGKLNLELGKLNVRKTGKYKKHNKTSLENLENLDL